jgi:hypothetical protein
MNYQTHIVIHVGIAKEQNNRIFVYNSRENWHKKEPLQTNIYNSIKSY